MSIFKRKVVPQPEKITTFRQLYKKDTGKDVDDLLSYVIWLENRRFKMLMHHEERIFFEAYNLAHEMKHKHFEDNGEFRICFDNAKAKIIREEEGLKLEWR